MSNSTLRPDQLLAVGGALGRRFHANISGRIKNVGLSEQYIRWHEDKDHDDWFWVGEQLGKWLDAAAYSALATKDQALLARIDELLERLARSQEADGYVGIVHSFRRNPARGMQLYEWYYVLLGLLTCYELLQSQTALPIAQRLAQFITRTWGVEPGQFPLAGPFPGDGHDGSEGTLILEPMARLGQLTKDAKLIEWCEATVGMWDSWLEQYPQARYTCGFTALKRYAAGEIEVYDLRENIHAHTLHMVLLGLAALYDATGKAVYRETVVDCIDRLMQDWIFITGAMSTGERYIQYRFYHPNSEVEICPQHTWILLLQQAYIWTGEARYLDEIERDTFNHLLAAQVADGSNWSYMTPLNGHAHKPESSNCCNASGMRILSRLPSYIYGLRDGSPAVLLYTESEAQISVPGLPSLTLCQTTNFPSDGQIEIRVEPEVPAQFSLALRIPYYVESGSVSVNSNEPIRDLKPGFLTLDRFWQPGDVVRITFDFGIRCQANSDQTAILRGPLVYAHFENSQPDHEDFYWHHSRYAGDITVVLDPLKPGATITEIDVSDDLVGPGLLVKGCISERAPMFTAGKTNQRLPISHEETILMLPFMNQGSIHGDYQVFKHYHLPTE